MIRWVRIAAIGGVVLGFIAIGIGVGLLLVANSNWVTVNIPEWLHWLLGEQPREVWLPALIGGWLAAFLVVAVQIVWSMFYVWRRRQYESLIGKLERELATLRNLPFTRPAPLEDLPEERDAESTRVARVAEEIDAELSGTSFEDAER